MKNLIIDHDQLCRENTEAVKVIEILLMGQIRKWILCREQEY